MGMLYMNDKLRQIKYSVTSEENIERVAKFRRLCKEFEDLEDPRNASYYLAIGGSHHPEIKLWHKIVFPVWIWKTFIHAKHEAFRFKYDSKSLMEVERDQMRFVGVGLYVNTGIYFGIMLGLPALFTKEECGHGLDAWVFYLYAGQAILTALAELAAVKHIERKVHDKEILQFNRWHVVELFMGQIARLDTFLDACFLVMLIQCEMWSLIVPVSIFIVLFLSYPLIQIFMLCRVDRTLAYTQPLMERNCFLAFIRESMLLATVLDSFCISNTVTICKKPIAFGKLMGAWTFFLQDFPQLTIHLYFLIFMHDEASLILHSHTLVLVSLVVSCFAIAISTFNFVMFKQNDFDPLAIEKELFMRRRSNQIERENFTVAALQEKRRRQMSEWVRQMSSSSKAQPTPRRSIRKLASAVLEEDENGDGKHPSLIAVED